jgi:hypothetical protein
MPRWERFQKSQRPIDSRSKHVVPAPRIVDPATDPVSFETTCIKPHNRPAEAAHSATTHLAAVFSPSA